MGGRSKREEIYVYIKLSQISQVALVVKNLPAKQEMPPKQEMWVPSLGQEYSLQKGMAIHSSILAREIAWT